MRGDRKDAPSGGPIFLASSERSGSSLLRVIMDAHPGICGPAPPHFLTVFPLLLHLYGDLREGENFRRLAEDMIEVLEHQMGSWRTSPTSDEIIERAEFHSFGGLLDAFYSFEAARRGKKRYFVKDNGVCQFLFLLHALFPDAQFVYLVRDARDVVSSWLESAVHFGDLRRASEVWAEEQREALLALSVLGGPEKIRLVRYEDLVREPEAVLSDLCRFLGEEFDPDMLDYSSTEEAVSSAGRIEAWKNLARPFMTESIGKYRTRLSGRHIREVEYIAGTEMSFLGYPLEGSREYEERPDFLLGRVRRSPLFAFLEAGRRALRLLSGTAGRREVGRRAARLKALKNIEKTAEKQGARESFLRTFKE